MLGKLGIHIEKNESQPSSNIINMNENQDLNLRPELKKTRRRTYKGKTS